ncbi:MAG: hypothetical protein H7315_03455 [Herminiimonas sp.]|nr:hypothetical protein [Herminiimonas sp.]
MIASLKIGNIAHLAVLKLAAAKSVIGLGVLVGGASTALVTTDILEPDYVMGATALINQMVDMEAGMPAVALPDERAVSTAPASTAVVDGDMAPENIPQIVITAKRMSASEKLAYDAQSLLQNLASLR